MNKLYLLTMLVLVLTQATFAQFEKNIFEKHLHLNRVDNPIYPLGDQNKDGYDDFMIYDCSDERGYIFFGGNPPDTIPVNSIKFFDSVYVTGAFAVIDINNDGIKDLVITTVKYLRDVGSFTKGEIRIYYGGSVMDTIPDLRFNFPEGASGGSPYVIKDYNGDGREELAIVDANLPNSEKQYGTFYFYNTKAVFDTIPEYILMGDSITGKSIPGIPRNEDINGDGRVDFTIIGNFEGNGEPVRFRDFYKGNENFDLKPEVTFKQNEHVFDLQGMSLIKDVTGRKNADILAEDYNNTYPFYYINTIWYGSFPIDTIPDIGINTQNQGIQFNKTFINDFNGDGYNDLIARTGAGQVKLWLGGKKFTEVAVQTWESTDFIYSITMLRDIGDFDGDGVQDFAIGLTQNTGMVPCVEGVLYVVKGDTSVKGDTTTGIKDEKILLPADFKLYTPYPNPFNSQTKIDYELKTEGLVEIKLYDTLGREIGLLLNEDKRSGKYSIELNAEKYKLASGVYIIRAEFYKGKNLTAQQSAKVTYLK